MTSSLELATRRLRVAAVLAVLLAGLTLAGCGGDGATGTAKVGGRTLASRTVEAGSVTVELTPKRVDAQGAEFGVSLDTHTGDLAVDLGRAASLTVAGAPWPLAGYDGDGPGGHHRSGVLSFRAIGPVQGSIELTIAGLDRPVTATWKL